MVLLEVMRDVLDYVTNVINLIDNRQQSCFCFLCHGNIFHQSSFRFGLKNSCKIFRRNSVRHQTLTDQSNPTFSLNTR
jgi:hypothetical protein